MDSIIPLGQKNTLAEYMILSGADNRSPMLDKDLHESWKSQMEIYMQNRERGRMIPESVENGPLIWPTVEENEERECKLYDAFDKFTHIKKESLHKYYLRFTQLINNMNIYNIKMELFQVNTQFLNSLPPEWSKFVTDVKIVKDLHTTNFDQLHAYLEQHELQENEVCLLRERDDPIACLNKAIAFLTTVASSRRESIKNVCKTKDPEAIKRKISNKPIDYVKLNQLYEDFGKCFVPQQELSSDEAFWYHMLNPSTKPFDALPVKIEAPKELPKVSLVNESLKKLKLHLANFDKVEKIRMFRKRVCKPIRVSWSIREDPRACSLDHLIPYNHKELQGPVTTEEKAQKKNDVKARSMLLMALSNEHLMTFNRYKDAKSLFSTIETRFGGNEATKKTQKTLLKQMYENFSPTSTYLPFEWNTHVVVWRNKHDLDTMSIDDLYNNFKIVEQEKTRKKITLNGSDTSSFDKSKVKCNNRQKIRHFARECRGPRNQDSRNRYQDSSKRTVNVEETPPKAMVAIDAVGFDWSYMAEDEVPTNMALMAFSDSETSKNVSKDIPNELKEYPNAPLVKDMVSDTKYCSVKSPVMVEKKTDVPTIAKVEFVRPKQQEKLAKKPDKYAEMYRPRVVNTARPREVNTARPNSAVVNAIKVKQSNMVGFGEMKQYNSQLVEYSQWVERFMNYLKEQTDGEAMINSIKNGDQPLPRVTQVSIARTTSTEQPPLKDKSMWSDQEKRIQKINRLARSLLIQRLLNDIYSLIDSNKTAKDLWDALARHMLGFEYVINDLKKCGYSKYNCELNFKFLNNLQPEWKQYATTMRQNKNLIDINIDALYNILKQNQGDVNDAMGSKKKIVVVTFDPLALIAEKTNVSKNKEKVVVSSNSEGKFVKSDDKQVVKKDDEKKRDMSRVKCYNYKKEGHFTKECKKAKVKDYEYYKTKMLLVKKDKDEQVLLAEDQA
uniref:Ribonuclease H-like domain-containing protein n=1 Tax=Tanacetum cinerariifolium TaxID=118510 RepID=A0A6L2JBC8_TANCI|nr:ribonuclease H-like domain-containing protein [Tanacetum cinerariifolium]